MVIGGIGVVLVLGAVLLWVLRAGGEEGPEAAEPGEADAPVTRIDRTEAKPGREATVDVLANDGGRGLRLVGVVQGPTDGRASIAPGGELVVRTNEDASGLAAVTYEVVDAEGRSAEGTVELDIGDRTGAEETAIAWTACTFPGEEPELRGPIEERFAANECARVDVPVDYADPEAGTLELFVTRREATAPDPLGPLFVNQGGPGMEAAEYSTTLAVNPNLDRFDLIGLDPRGTGRSTHPDCGEELELDWGTGTIPSPGDPTTDFESAARAVAEACASDPLVAHLGSNAAAADMDRMRELLGADQISYFGKSYGSDLGAAYASLYPERLRAAVLDGASDLTLDPVDFVAQQARAGLEHLDRYLAHCREDGCPWTGGEDPATAWTDLRADLDADPVVSEETGEPVTGVDLRDWYHQEAPTVTFDELDAALDLLVLERDPSEVEVEAFDDVALASAFFSTTCADLPVDDYRDAVARLVDHVADPPTDALVTLAACAAWPVDDPITITDAEGAGPILVVGTTGDVPTPLPSSAGLAEALAPARLLTWEAESHTAYLFSECVAAAADAVLVDLELPPRGTRCDDPLGWWMTGTPPRPPLDLPAA